MVTRCWVRRLRQDLMDNACYCAINTIGMSLCPDSRIIFTPPYGLFSGK